MSTDRSGYPDLLCVTGAVGLHCPSQTSWLVLLAALDLSGWALYRAMLRASPDRRSNYHVVLDVSYTRYCRFMTIKGPS